jgi:hypothetical protein
VKDALPCGIYNEFFFARVDDRGCGIAGIMKTRGSMGASR